MFKVGSVFVEMLLKDDKFNSGLGKASKSLKSNLTPSLANAEKGSKRFAKTLAGISVVGLGLFTKFALKPGLDRALKLDDARAKLKGLGYDLKQIEGITDDVLASVKGTAFSLDDAMTVSASALASGVTQGEKLTRYLKLTADAATIGGASMAEMGDIFNKVQAKNKMSAKETNMLMSRGIPILQWLGDEYGKTAEEMEKMVSDGKVNSEMFLQAVEKNIGGAALASGDTVRGSLANMQAAFARLGAKVMEGALPAIKSFAEWMMKLSDWVASGGLNEWLKEHGNKLLIVAGAITGALVPALVAWTKQAQKAALANIKMMIPLIPFILIGAAIGGIIYLIVQRMGGWQKVMKRLEPTFNRIKEFAEKAFVIIKDVVEDLYKKFQEAWPGIQKVLEDVWNNALQPILKELGRIFMEVIVPALQVLWEVVQFVWPIIVEVIKFAWKIIGPIFAVLYWVLMNVLVPVFLFLLRTIVPVFKGIVAVISWAWNNIIKPIWDVLYWYIVNILIPQFKIIWAVISWVWDKVSAAIKWAWDNVIKPIWDAVYAFIKDKLIPWFQRVWATVKYVFTKVKDWIQVRFDAVKIVFNRVKTWITDLIDRFRKIVDWIKNALSKVKDAITKPFKEAFDWIKEKVEGVKKALKKLVPWTKESPSLVDRITSGTKEIMKQYGNMFEYISDGAGVTRSGLMTSGAGGFATDIPVGGSSSQVNITVNMDGVWTASRADRRSLARDFIDAVNDDLRARGVEPLGGGYIKGDSDG